MPRASRPRMSRAHAARAASMASRAEATEVAATRAVLVMVVHRSPKRSACTELCACAQG